MGLNEAGWMEQQRRVLRKAEPPIFDPNTTSVTHTTVVETAKHPTSGTGSRPTTPAPPPIVKPHALHKH